MKHRIPAGTYAPSLKGTDFSVSVNEAGVLELRLRDSEEMLCRTTSPAELVRHARAKATGVPPSSTNGSGVNVPKWLGLRSGASGHCAPRKNIDKIFLSFAGIFPDADPNDDRIGEFSVAFVRLIELAPGATASQKDAVAATFRVRAAEKAAERIETLSEAQALLRAMAEKLGVSLEDLAQAS